jgi:hypothetical protein
MEGRSIPFVSFTLHDFYFIRLEIIFLIVQRDVLLHTTFSTGGGFVPHSVTKKFVKTWPPSPQSPPPLPRQCFMIFSCFSSFLQNRCVWIVHGSFGPSNNMRIASDNYLSCQSILMSLFIAGSKQYILHRGDPAYLNNREVGTKTEKSRDASKFMCPAACLCGI